MPLRRPKTIAAAMLLAAVPASVHAAQDRRAEAQAAYVAGDHAQAARILAELLSERPDDADLLRRLASVQAAQGNLAAAQETIDRALALAPADGDIRLARANILLWRGRLAEARGEADALAAARPGYPGLDTLDTALLHAQSARWLRLFSASAGASFSHASFESGFSQDWFVQRGAAAVTWGPGAIAALDVQREDRGPVDTRIGARLSAPAGKHVLFATGSVTPDPDFRESWSLGGGGDFAVSASDTLLLDGRFSRYSNDDVVALGAGLRHSFTPQFDLTARSIHLFGGGEDYRLGGALRADYRDAGPTDLFAIVASYPDAEVDGTRQLRGVAGGARFALARNYSLGVSAEYENRENSYERTAVSLDLGWRFGGRK